MLFAYIDLSSPHRRRPHVTGLSQSVHPKPRKGFLSNFYHVIESDDDDDDNEEEEEEEKEGEVEELGLTMIQSMRVICIKNGILTLFGIETAKTLCYIIKSETA